MKYFKIEIGDEKRRERESGEEGGWADHLGSERNDRAIIDLAPGNPTRSGNILVLSTFAKFSHWKLLGLQNVLKRLLVWREFLTADWNPVDQILPKQVKCTGLDFSSDEKLQSRKSKNDFPFPPVCKIGGLLANTFWHLEKKKYFMAMDPGQILPRKKGNSPQQYPWAGSRIFSAAFRQKYCRQDFAGRAID